jgi:hypothetical protein
MTSTCSASPGPDDKAVPYETWMVFIDPESGVRASGIIALAYRQHLPVRAKETCFGLMMEGERTVVRGFVGRLREAYPDGLFLKRRPFAIGDTKVCARTFRRLGMRRAAEQLKYHNHS